MGEFQSGPQRGKSDAFAVGSFLGTRTDGRSHSSKPLNLRFAESRTQSLLLYLVTWILEDISSASPNRRVVNGEHPAVRLECGPLERRFASV